MTDLPDINDLTVEQQRMLMDRLAYKLQDVKVSHRREHVAVWNAICDNVDTDKRLLPPLEVFVRTYGAQRYIARAEVFLDFVRESSKSTNRAVRAGLMNLVAECLATEVRRAGRSATPKTLLDMISHIQGAVNRSFPGYAAAGMLERAILPRARA